MKYFFIKKQYLISLCFCLFLVTACNDVSEKSKDNNSSKSYNKDISLVYHKSSARTESAINFDYLASEDVSYGEPGTHETRFMETYTSSYNKNLDDNDGNNRTFDIYFPASAIGNTVPLVIYIHGGGFITGSKNSIKNKPIFNILLSKGYAVASVNYRYLCYHTEVNGNEYRLKRSDSQGVLTCMYDCVDALQYIKFHCASIPVGNQEIGIDTERIILMGGSAGAGISLWIGLHNDMADSEAASEQQKQSTRVQGIIAVAPQFSYDMLLWAKASQNLLGDGNPVKSYNKIEDIVGAPLISLFYGLNFNEYNGYTSLLTTPMLCYGKEVRICNLITEDDPPLLIYNNQSTDPNETNSNFDWLVHHPLHSLILQNLYENAGLENGTFLITAYNESQEINFSQELLNFIGSVFQE